MSEDNGYAWAPFDPDAPHDFHELSSCEVESFTLRTSVEVIRADTEHTLRFVPGLRSASITYSDGWWMELTPGEAELMEAARKHGTDYLALTAQRIRAERGVSDPPGPAPTA